VQELEFLYSLMSRGLTPKEIEDEYQDTEFPPRQKRWIAGKRIYYEAVRKVIGDNIAKEQDPLVVNRVEKHSQALSELIDRLTLAITNLTLIPFHDEDGEIMVWTECGAPEETEVSKNIKNGRIIKFQLSVEDDPMFECLPSHLGEKIWGMFQEWKGSLVQSKQQELYSKAESDDWNEDLYEYMCKGKTKSLNN
jgi:hypothetical protein